MGGGNERTNGRRPWPRRTGGGGRREEGGGTGEKSSLLRPKNHDDAAGGRAANGHGRPDQLHAMRLGAHGGERLPRNGDTL